MKPFIFLLLLYPTAGDVPVCTKDRMGMNPFCFPPDYNKASATWLILYSLNLIFKCILFLKSIDFEKISVIYIYGFLLCNYPKRNADQYLLKKSEIRLKSGAKLLLLQVWITFLYLIWDRRDRLSDLARNKTKQNNTQQKAVSCLNIDFNMIIKCRICNLILLIRSFIVSLSVISGPNPTDKSVSSHPCWNIYFRSF